MKIVFLDIDGVLNYNGMLSDGTRMQNYGFAPELVDNLRKLILSTNSKIVISSSWRMYEDINEYIIGGKPWITILDNKLGLPNIVIGKIGFEYEYPAYWNSLNLDTESDRKDGQWRGYDIKKYLDQHNDIDKFVILDDYISECDIPQVFPDNYVRCYRGFRDNELTKALMILGYNN